MDDIVKHSASHVTNPECACSRKLSKFGAALTAELQAHCPSGANIQHPTFNVQRSAKASCIFAFSSHDSKD
jgi:hypothetical protein